MMEKFLKDELKKERIEFIPGALETIIDDFVRYCKEMEFETEQEFKKAATEYVQCQIHYGMIR